MRHIKYCKTWTSHCFNLHLTTHPHTSIRTHNIVFMLSCTHSLYFIRHNSSSADTCLTRYRRDCKHVKVQEGLLHLPLLSVNELLKTKHADSFWAYSQLHNTLIDNLDPTYTPNKNNVSKFTARSLSIISWRVCESYPIQPFPIVSAHLEGTFLSTLYLNNGTTEQCDLQKL